MNAPADMLRLRPAQTEEAIRELGRMNCRCSPGSVHPLESVSQPRQPSWAPRGNPIRGLAPRRSSGTALMLQSTEKVGEPGRHDLLNGVLCPEPATNGVAGMTRHRPGQLMDFFSRGR